MSRGRGALGSCRRKDVAVDVELIVLDPAWMIDVEGRRLFSAALEDRRDMQPEKAINRLDRSSESRPC